MLSIKCLRSKKGHLFYVLIWSTDRGDVYLNFDVQTLARVSGKSVRDIYLLDEGDVINIL